MSKPETQFHVSFAQSPEDIRAAQRLRYEVFVLELGGLGPFVDHAAQIEADPFDAHADHLILRDKTLPANSQVIGVCRIMNSAQATASNGFSCDAEYDLTALQTSGLRLLEMGRSCIHPDYRGSMALFHIWQALAAHVIANKIDILFGVASFHGTDVTKHAQGLTLLLREHQSPFSVPSRVPVPIPDVPLDRKTALREIPALIKAYLRLGGAVGQGAFIDRDFNTTDVCMVLEVSKMSARQKAIYTG